MAEAPVLGYAALEESVETVLGGRRGMGRSFGQLNQKGTAGHQT